MRNLILVTTLLFSSILFSGVAGAITLKELPVQNGGRIKPLDTLAGESVRLIYGKTKYKGKDPSTLVLTWLLAPKVWSETKFIQIKSRDLKKALTLDFKEDYFSQRVLSRNLALESLIQNLNVKIKKEVKLNAFDQALSRLQGQLRRLNEFQTGDILRVTPTKDSDRWLSINEFSKEHQEKFAEILKAVSVSLGDEEDTALRAKADEKTAEFSSFSMGSFEGDEKPILNTVKVEVFYNSFHPFRWAWISYLLALLFIFFFWLWKKPGLKCAFNIMLFAGFLLHLLGFFIRIYISGRAPVSNMYETVLWVPFGTVIFGYVVGKWNKSLMPYVGSCIVALFCLILSDLAPVLLDQSIQPLEAVLRSNFWLLTHVLTITISYSAFFLAFILGDFALFYHLNENKYREEIQAITVSIYRSLQIGILLLAVGTVLGGIWADYSWGRFWGWDPKETWAFIALMGYLALLHARLVRMVKSFGLAAGAVLSFSLVIMAWYGVNFWLGAGLHSYGFGSGGVEYVSVFVMLHIIYVIFVGVFKKLKNS